MSGSFASYQLDCLVASLLDSIWEVRSPGKLVADRSVVGGLEEVVVEEAVTAAVFRRRFIRDPPSSPLVEE